MAIALTLQKYLAAKNVHYDLMTHKPTRSSVRTAEACRVSYDRVAKAVLLRDETGYSLAILPASHHISFPELRSQLGDDVGLATEREAAELFQDCAPGALPAVGECYGLNWLSTTASRSNRKSIRGWGSWNLSAHEPCTICLSYSEGTARAFQRPQLRARGALAFLVRGDSPMVRTLA